MRAMVDFDHREHVHLARWIDADRFFAASEPVTMLDKAVELMV